MRKENLNKVSRFHLKFLALPMVLVLLSIGQLSANNDYELKTSSESSTTAQSEVKGVVKDAAGKPIVGATVIVKGTTTGAITLSDGSFSLDVKEGAILEVMFFGYKTAQVVVGKQTMLNVVLEEDSLSVDEVVVIGYGTARRSDLTGAISSVNATELSTQAPRSVEDLLRGNSSGLSIGMATSAKGASDNIQIRGNTTLKAGSDPLIVLDGAIYEGSLSDINPMDIATLDVLKDASSAAVYGAKSANGVIAITTKKGAQGKPVVNFNANVGVVTKSRAPSILDGDSFIDFRQDYEEGKYGESHLAKYPEIFTNPMMLTSVDQLSWYNYDKGTPVSSVSDEDLLRTWATRLDFKTNEIDNFINGTVTDWYDLVFQTGLQQDYTASISNRNETSSYYWSMGYADREGVVTGDEYSTFRTRLNLESKITDFLTIGTNAGFSSRDESAINCNWGYMRNVTPYCTNEIGVEGSPYQRLANGDVSCINPLYDRLYQDRKKMYTTLNATMYADVKLPFDIKYRMNFTPYYQFYEYYNHKSSKHESWAATGGESERTTSKRFNWQIDNIFSWEKTINEKHNISATFLLNSEKGQYWSQSAETYAYSPNDLLGYHNIAAGTVPSVSSDDTYQTGDALMGRLFYSFENKYMITASVRRDGYSAFGANNKRATFPSVALGWEFTREKFAENAGSWLNYGKLRASWGENGNRDIGQYEALSDMNSSLTPYINLSGGSYTISQLYVNQMSNNSLAWERTASFNFGLDYRVFNDKISGSIEYYSSKTNDLLVDRSLPNITGYNSVAANLGQLQNSGFEFSIGATAIEKPNFTWNINANFSLNRRKINSLYGDMTNVYDTEGNVIGEVEANDYANKWFIGEDPDVIWNYERDGVWQLGEEEEAAIYGCAPGDFKYIDQNGDGVMNNDDKEFLGHSTPRYRWTLHNQFQLFRDFSLSFTLYSYGGHLGEFDAAENNALYADRSSSYDLPRWTVGNPINDFARIGSKSIGSNYVKKTFVRLENVTASYNLPKNFINKFNVQNMSLSFSVRNAAVYCPGYNYFDPETGNLSPMTLNLGLNLTL